MTTARATRPIEHLVTLALDEVLELDVAFCDLVHARDPNPNGPFELRFRGQRRPDGAFVRFFAPLTQIEGALLGADVLRAPVSTDDVPTMGQGVPPAVPLAEHALRIVKVRRGNGAFAYDVAVRVARDGSDVAAYVQALRDAAQHALPVIAAAGFAVGAAELISVAGALHAARTYRTAREG